MCTAITLKTTDNECFFGRTMDFSYSLDPQLYLMPRDMKKPGSEDSRLFDTQYSSIGIGQEVSSRVLFADGVNEAGLSAAALYFPGYAHFTDPKDPVSDPSHKRIAAVELVNVLLGSCRSVEQCAALLKSIVLTSVQDPITNTVAPLHWITADTSGRCMVIEQTKSGLHLWNNPVGVLTNSPGFDWQMTNLRNYGGLSQTPPENPAWDGLKLPPFGQGAGGFGLPGDFTPPSRFVRTVFQKFHIRQPESSGEAVLSGFHILENVSIPKGVVVTERGTDDYTQYTAMLNNHTGAYFIKTYNNSGIVTASLPRGGFSGPKPVSLGKLYRPPVFSPMESAAPFRP